MAVYYCPVTMERGFYERLVGLVKRSMQKGIGQKHLTLEQLITFLAEAESIVNTRPLTYVYDEFNYFDSCPFSYVLFPAITDDCHRC